jgi:hypothetical protein
MQSIAAVAALAPPPARAYVLIEAHARLSSQCREGLRRMLITAQAALC